MMSLLETFSTYKEASILPDPILHHSEYPVLEWLHLDLFCPDP